MSPIWASALCMIDLSRGLEIDQLGYFYDVLEHFGMADANSHNMSLPLIATVD